MSYIPPHKRQSDGPSPIPESFRPDSRSSVTIRDRSGKITYAERAVSTWFAVGLDGDNHFPSSVQLEPVSMESIERRTGGKPLALANRNLGKG
jgi:hypothetical protein